MEPEGSLPHSQVSATCSSPELRTRQPDGNIRSVNKLSMWRNVMTYRGV